MSFPVSLEGTLTDVKEQSSTQKHPLGTRLVLNDGRVFHYAKAGSVNLAVGLLVCAPAVVAAENLHLTPDTTADCTTTMTNMTLGQPTTGTATTKNAFADGWMYVHAGTGKGQVAQLRSQYDSTGNAAGSTATAIEIYFADENYLSVALDTSSSKVGLVQNPYMEVVVCPAWADYTASGVPVGVPLATITAAYYFWLQTWGPCPIVMGNTPVEGEAIIAGGSSTGTAGDANPTYKLLTSAVTGGAVDFPQIGWVMSGDTDAEYALCYLTIAP